jgi:hypothetical protein
LLPGNCGVVGWNPHALQQGCIDRIAVEGWGRWIVAASTRTGKERVSLSGRIDGFDAAVGSLQTLKDFFRGPRKYHAFVETGSVEVRTEMPVGTHGKLA